jgi:hypothetical protein
MQSRMLDDILRISRALPAFAAASLMTGCDFGNGGTATPTLAAHDVSQPPGWDDELAMPVPQDLNPDPNVLEIELEARVTDLEILPARRRRRGLTTARCRAR